MNYYGPKDMAESWRTVRKNTIQVAEDMPEEKYSFRAAPDTMSVGEILAHLAATPHWANQCHFVAGKVAVTMDDFGKWMGEIGQVSKALTTKAAIVAALKADGDAFAAGLESMTDEKLAELYPTHADFVSQYEAAVDAALGATATLSVQPDTVGTFRVFVTVPAAAAPAEAPVEKASAAAPASGVPEGYATMTVADVKAAAAGWELVHEVRRAMQNHRSAART